MNRPSWWLRLVFFCFLLILFPFKMVHATQKCWSSIGGNGSAWLSGTVTAGGVGVADVNVYLQPKSWASGYSTVYENACTNSQGQYSFKTETSPATDCYTTYTYSGTSSTYCNWRSARCYQQCYSDNTTGSYSNQTLSLTNYKIAASLPWDSSLAESYGNCDSSAFDINFSSSQTVNCALPSKDQIIRIRVKDSSGSAIASGLTVYVSGPSYGSKTLDSSYKDFYVTAGSYYVGAYCTNYQSCQYSCISNKNVEVISTDTIKEVTVIAKTNDATIAGVVSGSDGGVLADANVSVGNYSYSASPSSDSCYSSGWARTNGSGAYSIALPAGTYTLWASPPYNSSGSTTTGSNYGNKEESVTLTSGATLTKNVVLTRKDSSISGSVKNSNGTGLSNVWVNAWTYGDEVHDWSSAQTDSSGNFSFPALKGVKYNVQAYYWSSASNSNDSDVSNCSKQGMVTAEAGAAGVNFTFAAWDHTVTFNLVDSSGAAISGVSGGGNIRPKTAATSELYCGTWVNMDSGTAKKKLAASTEYILEPYTWGSGSYDPQNAETTFTTGASGASSSVNITMIPVNATVSGSFKDGDGNAVSLDSNSISVYASRGSLWKNCTATSTSYSCKLSAGGWHLGYWVNGMSGFTSLAQGSSTNRITVTANSTQTLDITVLKTAYINVTVKNSNGSALKWVWVEANPYSAADEGGDSTKRMYGTNGCSADGEGKCKVTVGASSSGTTYYLNAHRPWSELNDENVTLPQEVKVTVKAGETADAGTLTFRVLDGELAITATAASETTASLNPNIALPSPVINAKATLASDIISGVFISCFSELAGYAEATTDTSGKATVKCASGDIWHCFGVNQLGNNLYISEDAEATCVAKGFGATAMTIKLNAAGTIPDAVSQTWDAGGANTITLSDNFSITFPAASLGASGNVSCTVQPDPILPYQSGKRPANKYGYDVSCNDAQGKAITAFTADATICQPFSDDQNKLLDLTAADCQLVYRDTSTDAYNSLSSVTVDDTNNTICGKTNHLTEFVVVGNGNLKGVDGDSEGPTEEAQRTGETGTGSGVGGGGGGGWCSMNPSVVIPNGIPHFLMGFAGFIALFLSLRSRHGV